MGNSDSNYNENYSLYITLENGKIIVLTGDIYDIFRLSQLTPVPFTCESILGICNHRGRITTIFSLETLLIGNQHSPSPKFTQSCLCVCFEHNKALYAFPVKSVDDFPEEPDQETMIVAKSKVMELLLQV
jgi:chemotaxis signal transduction protein